MNLKNKLGHQGELVSNFATLVIYIANNIFKGSKNVSNQ